MHLFLCTLRQDGSSHIASSVQMCDNTVMKTFSLFWISKVCQIWGATRFSPVTQDHCYCIYRCNTILDWQWVSPVIVLFSNMGMGMWVCVMEWKPGKIFIIEGSIENLLCGRRSVKWGKVPVAAKVGKKVPVARFFFFALWPKSVASRLRNCQSGHLR